MATLPPSMGTIVLFRQPLLEPHKLLSLHDDSPSDPLAAAAREPEACGADVLGGANTLGGQDAGDLVLHRVEGVLHHLGAERAERERVDGDVAGHLRREVAREPGVRCVLIGPGGTYW